MAEVPHETASNDVTSFPLAYDPVPNSLSSVMDANEPIVPVNGFGVPVADPSVPVGSISADEIALYDRQIRLWGVKAQEMLRNANILLIGLKALGDEIAKNLVLAGIGTLTILDEQDVTEDDLCSQFFVSTEHLGQNRAAAALPQIQKLNPRVQLFSDPEPARSKLPEYFSSFDITIATGLPLEQLSGINAYCRIWSRKFYAADTHGMYGYVFADLILHDFVVESERSNKVPRPLDVESPTRNIQSVSTKRENDKVMDIITKREAYSPILLANSSPLPASVTKNRRSRLRVTPLLSCLRALFDFQQRSGGRLPGHEQADLMLFTKLAQDKHLELQLPTETLRAEFLRSFLQNLGSELSPVAAFLGGALAQDVINVLGQREQPIQNLLLFDGEDFSGPIYGMHPIFDENLISAAIPNGVATGVSDFVNGATVTVERY